MPTLVAATESNSGTERSIPAATMRSSASASATNAPVTDAVRVPPSAWITSQSSHTVRSPSAFRSVTARSVRPIMRWISSVRPDWRPRVDFARRALLGGARQHSVFAGHPAFARAFQKRGHAIVHRGRDDHARVARFNQHAAFGAGNEIRSDFHRPQIFRRASICSQEKLLRSRAFYRQAIFDYGQRMCQSPEISARSF